MRLRSIAPQGFWALKSQGFRNAIRFRPDSASQPVPPKTKRSGCGIDCAAIPSGVSQGLLLGGPYGLRWLLSGTMPLRPTSPRDRGGDRIVRDSGWTFPTHQLKAPIERGKRWAALEPIPRVGGKQDQRLASREPCQFAMVAWKGTSNVQGKEATTIQSAQGCS